jgi:hypothetical protein
MDGHAIDFSGRSYDGNSGKARLGYMANGWLDHLGREYRSIPNFDRDWKDRPLAINTTHDGIICIASIPSGKGTDILYGTKCEIYLYPDGTYCADILKSWHSFPGSETVRIASAQALHSAPQHFKLPWEE